MQNCSRFRAFLIIIIAVNVAQSAETSHSTFDCLAAYAKTKGITDPAFDSIDYDSSQAECVRMRHKFISDVRKEIRTKISEAGILPKYSNCIYEKLTGSEFIVNSIIKTAALEHLEVPQHSSKTTVDTLLDYIKSFVVSCKTESDFGDDFDALFESQKKAAKNLTDHQEAYCVKKYLIKNNLIDTELYHIDPNPQNINVTGLNCEQMIKKANEDIYEQLSLVYSQSANLGNVECALEKFREADYFDLMMKIIALTTVDLKTEQRVIERDNFIGIVKRISSNIASC